MEFWKGGIHAGEFWGGSSSHLLSMWRRGGHTIRERAVIGLDSGLMCRLLGYAVENEGKVELPGEAMVDTAVVEMLGFLVQQRWLRELGAGRWSVTRAGRFWFASLGYGHILKFHEYGGEVFLLHIATNATETVVWHRGRFATIGIARGAWREHFEVRIENEPVAMPAGAQMEEALAAACALLAEDLEPSERRQQMKEIRLQMREYVERL